MEKDIRDLRKGVLMSNIELMAGIALAIVSLFPGVIGAQEMRTINLIATPAPLPPGAERVAAPKPIDVGTVKANVEEFMSKWNAGDLGGMISDNFYEKSRFQDSMLSNVPRDARLQVEGMGGVQTLRQIVVDDPAGGRMRITTGSVTVKTQIEMNDPNQGFVKVPGTNEIIFEMIQKEK
jgi:hypothetical protein